MPMMPQDAGGMPGMPAGMSPEGGGMPDMGGGPAGSPMSEPQGNEGKKAQGMSMVQLAIEMLSQAYPMLGAMTDEGEAVMGALKSLTKKTGQKANQQADIMPAQIEMMRNSVTGGPDVATLMAMQRQGGGGQPGPGGPFMQQ